MEVSLLGIIFTALFLTLTGHLEASNRSQLFNDVVYKLNPDVAPFESSKTRTTVMITVNLMGISDMNEKQQTMAASYWVVLSWIDYRLRWNSSLYNNITSVQVNADKIWSPKSICLFNEIGNDKCFNAREDPVTVHSTRFAVFMKYLESVSQCLIDVTSYPFDSHVCSLVFGNVNSYTEFLEFDEKNSFFLLQYHQPNEIWDIENTTFRIYEFRDPTLGGTYQQLHFYIQLKRKSFYLVISTVIPIIILSVLNMCCFLVPIQSGEKMGFCMAIFLTFSVFLTIINDSMPKSSDKISYFTIYLLTQLVISGLVVILEAIVLLYHFHFVSNRKEKANTEKSFCKKCQITGVHLDIIFFIFILVCNIFSIVFFIVNVV
ncbi:neuronal acetylcholine receptor subunit alpha-7-like [Ostrea edulis]|uniref:neuronal acetylcholine receptor subunit alpha-7-like n=1 Tax=Ostrea edulis TaxID=37623 RepID=UPI0024AF63B8|nr:neuronal acetylcholine receptor subunit alpha-7-like [Ostrea edulis]